MSDWPCYSFPQYLEPELKSERPAFLWDIPSHRIFEHVTAILRRTSKSIEISRCTSACKSISHVGMGYGVKDTIFLRHSRVALPGSLRLVGHCDRPAVSGKQQTSHIN